MCDFDVAPIPQIEAVETLCACSNDGFQVDGSASSGENEYTWQVCKLDANENTMECKQESFFNDVGTLDIETFYTEQGGNWECGLDYRVTLTVSNSCALSATTSIDVATNCDITIDYPDFVYCADEELVPIQGTNTCENCIFEWDVPDLAIIDDRNKPFPNIVAFPPGNGWLDMSIKATDPVTGCVCEDEVRMRKFAEPRIIDVQVEQLAPCVGRIQARFWGSVPLEYLDYRLEDEDGNTYEGEASLNPNNPDMIIVNYPFSEHTQFLMENTSYTFSVGIRTDAGELEGFESFNCMDSEEVEVGALYYFGDFPSLFFPNVFNPYSDVPNNSEWIIFAPEEIGYNASYYKLSIFNEWGGEVLYIKEEIRNSSEPPFQFNHIRWDGKLRKCLFDHCYPEGSNPNNAPVRCSDFEDGEDICFNENGEPRYWPVDSYVYLLRLINCSQEQIYSGSLQILY